jgi:hypothetical protein
MRELAVITGTSLSAILSWEKGKFKPKRDKKAALVALRKVTKRDVKKMLAEKAKKMKPGKGRKRKAQGKKR